MLQSREARAAAMGASVSTWASRGIVGPKPGAIFAFLPAGNFENESVQFLTLLVMCAKFSVWKIEVGKKEASDKDGFFFFLF